MAKNEALDESIPVLSRLKRASEPILAVAAVVCLIWGTVTFIDGRVKGIVNSDEFIKKVSDRVRPTVIFDENESIILDRGAMNYLEKIEVQSKKKEPDLQDDFRIIITPKQYLATPPLLERVYAHGVGVKSMRGKGFEWIYTFGTGMFLADEAETNQFRLEILK